LKGALRNKFLNYKPEPAAMPFHTRLLGKDRLALFSFIHSLNTNFGTSIFEPVATALAEGTFKPSRQVVAGDKISEGSYQVIQSIITELTTAQGSPDKTSEIARIRAVCRAGKMVEAHPTKVDICLESPGGEIYLFDIKTAKPNVGNFKEFKRTLLEWVAAVLADEPMADVNTLIAIPYNPYAPKPYSRWTIRGMLDLPNELKVAEEFWDFIGGEGAFQDLLDCFERVGVELRPEIDDYFARFNLN
jgi:type II restriction enzyme